MSDPAGVLADTFRTQARAWLRAHFPRVLAHDRMAQLAEQVGATPAPEAIRWKASMGAKGWGAPLWPETYGGGGLTIEQADILAQEMARIGAYNPIGGMGVMMFGPTLLEVGTEAQKARHIPPIVRGELRWCQGYSEPGSGSDLASLQTRCEDQGDHFLVNGQKIWTSNADSADWCFCLVRTDRSAKKHDGISFLLIDMRSPGVETRPIPLINGASAFCETFFTDVLVPKENLMGPLNGGWAIAKRLLQFERANISASLGSGTSPIMGRSAAEPHVVARDYIGQDAAGRLNDLDFRQRLVRHHMESHAFRLTSQRAAAEASGQAGPSATTSIMKYASAKIAQERAELIVEAMGLRGLGWQGPPFEPVELETTRTWLRTKANSIEGGTSEVNLNVIAKRILGLPDPK